MNNLTKKRLDYLDMVKGVGIFLVVLGHVYTSNILRTWIYSFHIPMFFIISGVLIKHTNTEKKDIKNVVISKFKSLIIPYLFFEILGIIILLIQYGFTISNFTSLFADSIVLKCKAGATWFLPVLFAVEIIFLLMRKYLKNNNIIIVLTSLLFIIPFLITTNNHYIILILRTFTALGFLTFGYFQYNNITEREMSYSTISILFFICVILAKINGAVDLWSLEFRNPIIYIICSVIGTILMIMLFKKVNKSKIILYLGVNSLIIMATHQPILWQINRVTGEEHGYIGGILLSLLIILIESIIIYIINNYAPWMLGKFKKKEKIEQRLA